MIYTAVCFGYSLTEEFGAHFESIDGGDWFQGDCVEVNDLKDVLEIEENQDFDKIDVFLEFSCVVILNVQHLMNINLILMMLIYD